MKILLFGFLTLCGWSAISTDIWICRVKGLCNDHVTVQTDDRDYKNTMARDSEKLSAPESETISPGELTIYFDFDKYEFISDESVEKYYSDSKNYLDNNPELLLRITGYADATGSVDYNQALGYRRAKTIHSYFNEMGLETIRIKTESKGEGDPVGDNKTASGRSINRRTVITIK